MPKPVILAAVLIDGVLHAVWNRDMVVSVDNLFAAFNDPGEDGTTSMVVEMLAVILDVTAAGNLGIKRNDNQSPPDTIIGRTDAREVVGIKDQGVAGLEGKWILILLFCKDIVGRAELFDGGVIEPCSFLHLGSDKKPLAFDLSHFRFDVAAAAYR